MPVPLCAVDMITSRNCFRRTPQQSGLRDSGFAATTATVPLRLTRGLGVHYKIHSIVRARTRVTPTHAHARTVTERHRDGAKQTLATS